MNTYEMIREIFSSCSGKPTTSVEEVVAESPDAYMQQFLFHDAQCSRQVLDNGGVQFDVYLAGIHSRYVFTAI